MPSAIPFDDEQRDLVRSIASAWTDRAPLLARLDEFVGGMAFKTVTGADYLVRYRSDPITKKKRFASLGRRSEKTERLLTNWLADRQAHQAKLADLDGRIEQMGRLAKAYRLGRVPGKIGGLLRRLDERGFLGDRVVVRGGVALFAYEMEAGTFASFNFQNPDTFVDIQLLALEDRSRLLSDMTEAFGDEIRLESKTDGVLGLMTDVSFIVVDAPYDSLTDRTLRQITVSRDSKPVPMVVPSRPDWIAIEAALGSHVEDERADFVRSTMSDDELEFTTNRRISRL